MLHKNGLLPDFYKMTLIRPRRAFSWHTKHIALQLEFLKNIKGLQTGLCPRQVEQDNFSNSIIVSKVITHRISCTVGYQIQQSTIQYADLLVCWDKWLIHQVSDVPSVILFSWFLVKFFEKIYIFIFFPKIYKNKNKESIRNYKKNNAWNITRLVGESFVPANQQISISYCRLSDFR